MGSVGIVRAQLAQFDTPFELSCGQTLPGIELVYETYGELNAERSNAVLICHALSGDHHAAGKYAEDDRKAGWWDHYIGPGKPIDTDRFYVVSLNNIGGCSGSTGPATINPQTGRHWGPDFPPIRVRDWVQSQHWLMDYLGLDHWAAVVGGSLGGMQAMRWALEYPDKVRNCVVIAAALKLSAQNIAFNKTSRTAIMSDPNFHEGHYYERDIVPHSGLSIARMIGHITYLSDDVMGKKFGRDLRSGSFDRGAESELEFQIESYLDYQGGLFSQRFDANTYILMTRALDMFDLAREYDDDAVAAFRRARCRFLVVSFTTDWRFPPARSREIVDALLAAEQPVTYAAIESDYGHDAFLLPGERYEAVFSAFMNNIDLVAGERAEVASAQ